MAGGQINGQVLVDDLRIAYDEWLAAGGNPPTLLDDEELIAESVMHYASVLRRWKRNGLGMS